MKELDVGTAGTRIKDYLNGDVVDSMIWEKPFHVSGDVD